MFIVDLVFTMKAPTVEELKAAGVGHHGQIYANPKIFLTFDVALLCLAAPRRRTFCDARTLQGAKPVSRVRCQPRPKVWCPGERRWRFGCTVDIDELVPRCLPG